MNTEKITLSQFAQKCYAVGNLINEYLETHNNIEIDAVRSVPSIGVATADHGNPIEELQEWLTQREAPVVNIIDPIRRFRYTDIRDEKRGGYLLDTQWFINRKVE